LKKRKGMKENEECEERNNIKTRRSSEEEIRKI
jgi:hypothetical protein